MPEERYREVVEELRADPEVSEGKTFGMPAVKVGRRVFAGLFEDGLVVKLGRERVEEMTAAGQATAFDPMGGRPMKDWALVPAGHEDWLALAEEAKRFLAED